MRNKTLKSNARRLRKDMTDAERHLWRTLRLRQVKGTKFRRQYVVGSYIVDFACLERRVVIEADGGQHLESENDKERDTYLHEHGWRVLRFWNDDILLRTDEVLAAIWEAISDEHPHPDLPPQAGEGDKRGETP